MATQLGIGKSIAVLAVVVGCFSVLWPKIFFPMLQAVFYGTSPDRDTFAAEALRAASRDRNTNPRIREDMGQARPSDTARENKRGRPFPPVAMRTPPRPMAKTGGAMNLVMPLYTIGIVVFFVYTILQLACKKSPAESRTQTRVLPMDCPCEETIRQKLAARQLLRDYGGRQDKVPGSPAADASSFLRRGQRDQLGRSIGILVKELTLQSQRQAGLERRQERCCGAGSPARRATGVAERASESPHVERADQCLRQRKVRGGPRPTCSCGAPLEGATVEDLESDCDDDGWGRDSEDYDVEPALGSNEEETCARASC